MDLRTYRGTTMAGALAEVKKDLGPDAVIVRTRSYRTGGVLGFGGRAIVEITAASDSAEITPRRVPPAKQTTGQTAGQTASQTAGQTAGQADGQPGGRTSTPQTSSATAVAASARPDDRRRTVAPRAPVAVRPSADEPEPRGMGGVGLASAPATRVRFAPETPQAHAALESELASIRRMVGEVLQTARRTAVQIDGADATVASSAGRPSPLNDLYQRLCDQDVPGEWIDELIADARADLSAAESEDPVVVRETATRLLAARFRVAPPCEPTPGSPVIETLIGPTGVGKTTTIAKLAAVHKLRYGRSVGLVTADTYRIAAVEQLRTYAGIIGIPLEVVLTHDEMRSAVDRFSSCDVVLIDTPGRSPKDWARLEDLRAFLDAAGSSRTHLVASAISSEAVLRSVADRFGSLAPDALLLTKLDEAATMGVICQAAEITGLPIGSITTGQEVPDHIETARADRLARIVLSGSAEPLERVGIAARPGKAGPA